MKLIFIVSKSTPEQFGYLDRGSVIIDDETILWHGSMSCCPNPHQVSTKKPWREAYGWLQCSEYPWECINHPKHGKCILLASGAELPARAPNVNHNGRAVVTEVMIHKGQSSSWRGSAACLTLDPDMWGSFICCFEIGEKGRIIIQQGAENGKHL
jgi:hypothetical protein